jgi:hypothetical protein
MIKDNTKGFYRITKELAKRTKEIQGISNIQTLDTALELSNACYLAGFRFVNGELQQLKKIT